MTTLIVQFRVKVVIVISDKAKKRYISNNKKKQSYGKREQNITNRFKNCQRMV